MIRLLAGTEESATDHSKFLNNKDQLTFAKWIDDGLHWRVPNASPEFVITEEHREFWSFQPVAPRSIPDSLSESTNPLDHFIQKRIEQAKIQQKAQEAQMDAQVDMQKAQMRQSLEERRLAQQKEIAAAKIQADLLKSRN